jgi:hypothetical protein
MSYEYERFHNFQIYNWYILGKIGTGGTGIGGGKGFFP